MSVMKSIWVLGCLLLPTLVNAQGVEVWLKDEAVSESNSLKPRYYIKNTGNTPLKGFEYLFYFKADASKTVILENYYNPGTTPVLEPLGGGNYRVRLSYLNTTIPAGAVFPGIWGSVFGIHYLDWSRWNKQADPALKGVGGVFNIHTSSVILDAAGNVLSGNPPTEPPPSADPLKANIAVAFRDQALNQNNVVQPVIKLRNVGTSAISNFELRYYFTTENKKKPILDVYHAPQGIQLQLDARGGDEYSVHIKLDGITLLPGQALDEGGVQFALHYSDYSVWNKANDFSYKAQNISGNYVLNQKVPAYYAASGRNFDVISGLQPPLMSATGAPGTSGSTSVPVVTPKLTTGGFFSVALAKDGTLHSWGLDVRSNLGNSRVRTGLDLQGGSLGMYPRQITGLSDIKDVECESQHCFALRSNGDLYTWGNTDRYGLNNQQYSNSSIPLKVVGLANIKQFSTSSYARNLALDDDGKVFQWGMPTNLHEDWVGDPAQVQISSALQSGESITKVISCETGPGSYALTSKGRLLNWNRHNDVQFTPVALTNVSDLHCGPGTNYAINTSGEVWAWGNNSSGELGVGTKTEVTTPIKISGLTNVKDIRTGRFHTLFLLENGSLYGAGENRRGEIDPTTSVTEYLSPHLVPGVSGITSMDAGDQFSMAMNTSGQVYGWGYNSDWRLGVGHQSPVTAPTLTLFNPNGLQFQAKQESGEDSYRAMVLENNYDATRDFSLNLKGLSSNDIYVVLTNVGEQNSAVSGGAGTGVVASIPSSGYREAILADVNAPHFDEVAINDEDLGPSPFINATITAPAAGVSSFKVGDTKTWNTSSDATKLYHPVDVTLKLQHTYNGMVFNAWVSAAAWGTGTDQLTQAKLESLIDAFAGSNDAVYAKVKGITGNEWGLHAKTTAYIAETQKDFHLVFYDIANEGNPILKFASGYFWGDNNVLKKHFAYSNEALAIHINSKDAATNQNGTILTMAHELQHMIFYYNKSVLGQITNPTWMNEMLSMLVEDVLAEDLIGFGEWDAPVSQRLLYHGLDMNVNLDNWDKATERLPYYASAFSLGGYLLRQSPSNYNGQSLLSYLYSTTSTGWSAMEGYMLQSSLNRDMTLPEALRCKTVSYAWNLDVESPMPQYYGYPTATLNDFNLESRFDFWNHGWGYNDDAIPPVFHGYVPTIYSTPPGTLNQKGSVIWKWQTAATGDQNYTLTLPPNTWATVFVKP